VHQCWFARCTARRTRAVGGFVSGLVWNRLGCGFVGGLLALLVAANVAAAGERIVYTDSSQDDLYVTDRGDLSTSHLLATDAFNGALSSDGSEVLYTDQPYYSPGTRIVRKGRGWHRLDHGVPSAALGRPVSRCRQSSAILARRAMDSLHLLGGLGRLRSI
jgi:hypothetical protein